MHADSDGLVLSSSFFYSFSVWNKIQCVNWNKFKMLGGTAHLCRDIHKHLLARLTNGVYLDSMIGWFACFHGFCRTGEFGHPVDARAEAGTDQWRREREITSLRCWGRCLLSCSLPWLWWLHRGCWCLLVMLTSAHSSPSDWLTGNWGWTGRARPGPGLSSADQSPAQAPPATLQISAFRPSVLFPRYCYSSRRSPPPIASVLTLDRVLPFSHPMWRDA